MLLFNFNLESADSMLSIGYYSKGYSMQMEVESSVARDSIINHINNSNAIIFWSLSNIA